MESFLVLLLIAWILTTIINTVRISAQKSRISRLEFTIETLERAVEKLKHTLEHLTAATAHTDETQTADNKEEVPAQAVHKMQADTQTDINTDSTHGNEKEQHPDSAPANPAVQDSYAFTAAAHSTDEKKAAPSAFETFLKKQLSIESVITKLGILLLLIGIGYVFKLVHDKGFIREEFILLIGVFAGAAFTAIGFFVQKRKRIVLAQVLFGGAIAVFYLTAFAAYVRYEILNDTAAFIFLAVITFSAYILAVTIASVSVSVIGLLGSLFIPFIVGQNFFGIASFGLYILTVAFLSTLVYLFKRWRVLQFSSLVSLLSVLTKLLLSSSLTAHDAQLFLGLTLALWLIHLLPDFYIFLSGKEKPRDKIYSPIAAAVNFGFSLFFGFKLTVFELLPPASVYLLFTFLYALLSCVCLIKDKVKTLGYAYIAGALISAYISIVARLQYDAQPAAVLGIALFLYWLWRKETKYNLTLFAHAVLIAGLYMVSGALETGYRESKTALHFGAQTALYFAPMAASIFLQKSRLKKIFQTLVFQIYVCIAALAVATKASSFNGDKTFLLYALTLTVLFAVYSLLHYINKNLFYEQSLYAAPILIGLCTVAYSVAVNMWWHQEHAAPVLLQCGIAGALAGFSFFKGQHEKLRFANRLSCYLIVLKVCLVDFTDFSYGFHASILLAAVPIILTDLFYPNNLHAVTLTKKISKLSLCVLIVIYYAVYVFEKESGSAIKIGTLAVNLCNGLVFIKIVHGFKPPRAWLFAAVSAVFVFFSTTEVYMPLKNGGLLTMLWALYAIICFIYFLKKGARNFVYTSLVFIVIVAAKLIFIDLHSISVLSKAITSSIFGAALLALSYAVQPLLKRFAVQSK